MIHKILVLSIQFSFTSYPATDLKAPSLLLIILHCAAGSIIKDCLVYALYILFLKSNSAVIEII